MVESEHRLNTWQIPTVAAVKRPRRSTETAEEGHMCSGPSPQLTEQTQQPNYQATEMDEGSPGSQGIGTSYRRLARRGRSHRRSTLAEMRRRCRRING